MVRKLTLLGLLCALIGCGPQSAVNTQLPTTYSGFLGGYYTQLQSTTSPSGVPVMRWISPQLSQGGYRQVVINPTQFYPQPQTSAQLYTDTLQQLLDYIDTDLYQNLSAVTKVVQPQIPGVTLEHTLRLQVAISGVTAVERGLQLFDDETTISVEYKITDALSNEVLAAGVRKGFGKPLTHAYDVITLDDLAPVIDTWTQDAASFFVKMSN